ncbi:MAG: hypothetical protein JSW39_21995 [Desulfobacterales bacterium]|nr:MAG: hypothetical protein JSW39_21995 [Desulfobacterales bacterium]
MPAKPRFSYFLAHRKNPVAENSALWQATLPLRRDPSLPPPQDQAVTSITYGEYFSAVRNFVEFEDFQVILGAATQHLQTDLKVRHIEQICVFLEKHGEFYHPARIEACIQRKKIPLVLNVALSAVGQDSIQREFNVLKRLNEEFASGFLPQVYGLGQAVTPQGHKISMFLGQWFEGYREFHISRDPADEKEKIVIWNATPGRFFLAPRQAKELYRQAARILTFYYNLQTFEQIFPWHHAAGDFVARVENDQIDLRLITVRRYASLFKDLDGAAGPCAKNAALILQALLVFFLNLSIRMRLDRLDGVGDIVWADPPAVQGALQGVLDGLVFKPQLPLLPDAPVECFRYYLSACSAADLYALCDALTRTYHPQAPEVPVIRGNLKEHVRTLRQALDQLQKIQTA